MKKIFLILFLLAFSLVACSTSTQPLLLIPTATVAAEEEAVPAVVTPYPTRPAYEPGELVDYIAQTGDTLPALAARFNTTEAEIRLANPIIPPDATTMPPGMPMQIPIYYRALWGNPYQIIPDAAFVNGPDVSSFNTSQFINQQQGWFYQYEAWAFNGTRTAAEIVNYVAANYSVSPKLLLALLEYQAGIFTQPSISPDAEAYLLGVNSPFAVGVYLQLSRAANMLNDGYYQWRDGNLIEFELEDGSIVRPDPWQNAATVALQYFFAQIMDVDSYNRAVGEEGFAQTYQRLFGDPWGMEPHIAGSLKQPDLALPYINDVTWAFTGGPHTGWGSLFPWTALDFAPPAEHSGCDISPIPTTAVAGGVVVRDGEGLLILDLDGDGDEHTGWNIFYLHIANEGRVPVGTVVEAGDFLGYPSCEGGHSTGTHIHIARKYNGEWISASGVIPFVLSGWQPLAGDAAYSGYLVKGDTYIVANTKPDNRSAIPVDGTNQ
jgi:murein DD-endopeptidase MepM/ murein hydrolase activator NlpD